MDKIMNNPFVLYSFIAFAGLMAYFGAQAAADLWRKRKSRMAADQTDENTDVWAAFPGPIHWTGHCTYCGWECKVGKTTTSFFLAMTEDEAKAKILSYHQAQIAGGVGAPHHPAMDDITVEPINPPT